MENISWTDRAKVLTGGNNLGILQKKRMASKVKRRSYEAYGGETIHKGSIL